MNKTREDAPAIRLLREAGFEATPMEYDYVERGGTRDAARKLGVDEHAVVKSLVFDNGAEGDAKRAVMALTHGDERISMHKLQRMSGIHHLLPASPETAFELTGYRPGGICPFGLKTPMPVFMQETLLDLPTLYINAGERGVVAAISPRALSAASPISGDLSSESSPRRL